MVQNKKLGKLTPTDSGFFAFPVALFTGFAFVVLFLAAGKPNFTFDSTF